MGVLMNQNQSYSGGGTGSLSGLTDVALNSTQNGQALLYDSSSSKWKNQDLPSGGHVMSPTPSASLTESQIVTAVNAGKTQGGANENVPSLNTIGTWSNVFTFRRIMSGSSLGTLITATGIGTWADDGGPVEAEPAGSENPSSLGWYELNSAGTDYTTSSDTSVDSSKTYYTSVPDESDWWHDELFKIPDNCDDADIDFKFDNTGDPVAMKGYQLDTTTGNLCIAFNNEVTVATCKIAVDVSYTRNEVV